MRISGCHIGRSADDEVEYIASDGRGPVSRREFDIRQREQSRIFACDGQRILGNIGCSHVAQPSFLRNRESDSAAPGAEIGNLPFCPLWNPYKHLFDKQTPLKFVYSENRSVKLAKKFPKTDQALKEVPALIAEVVKLANPK